MKMLGLSRGTIAVGIATLVLGATALVPGSFGTALAQTGDPPPQAPSVVVAPPTGIDPLVDIGAKDIEVVIPGTTATVEVVTGNIATEVTIPPGALPSGTIVDVAPITNMAQLESLQALPADVDIVAGIQITATGPGGGGPIAGDFPAPVTIEFTVSGSSVPVGATPETLTVAYWTGTTWSSGGYGLEERGRHVVRGRRRDALHHVRRDARAEPHAVPRRFPRVQHGWLRAGRVRRRIVLAARGRSHTSGWVGRVDPERPR